MGSSSEALPQLPLRTASGLRPGFFDFRHELLQFAPFGHLQKPMSRRYGVAEVGFSTINVPAMNELTHEGGLTCLGLLT